MRLMLVVLLLVGTVAAGRLKGTPSTRLASHLSPLASCVTPAVAPCVDPLVDEAARRVLATDAPPGGRAMTHLDRIFIIHYSKLGQRKERLTQRLRASGLHAQVTWLSGFDRNTIPVEVQTCLFGVPPRAVGAKAVSGAAAGSYTHAGIYAAMLQRGWKNVLVMEDDAIPIPTQPGEVEGSEKVIPDTIYEKVLDNLASGPSTWPNLHPRLQRAARCVSGSKADIVQVAPNAAGFIVTLEGARKMLGLLSTSREHTGRLLPGADVLFAGAAVGGLPMISVVAELCDAGNGDATHSKEDFRKTGVCDSWLPFNWQAFSEYVDCSKLVVSHIKRPLWANGGKGSWYGEKKGAVELRRYTPSPHAPVEDLSPCGDLIREGVF